MFVVDTMMREEFCVESRGPSHSNESDSDTAHFWGGSFDQRHFSLILLSLARHPSSLDFALHLLHYLLRFHTKTVPSLKHISDKAKASARNRRQPGI